MVKRDRRLKAEGLQGGAMRDHPTLRAFELADEQTYSKRLGFMPSEDLLLIEPKVIETEKVLSGLMRALRDVL
jgi:hypothetical protein